MVDSATTNIHFYIERLFLNGNKQFSINVSGIIPLGNSLGFQNCSSLVILVANWLYSSSAKMSSLCSPSWAGTVQTEGDGKEESIRNTLNESGWNPVTEWVCVAAVCLHRVEDAVWAVSLLWRKWDRARRGSALKTSHCATCSNLKQMATWYSYLSRLTWRKVQMSPWLVCLD